MKPIHSLLGLLRRTSFSRQLATVVAAAVLSIAIVSSLAISWQTSRQISTSLIEQGRQVAENLARQSKLALLYDSPENAAGVITLTLAFPDVASLEIRHTDGSLLLSRSNDKEARNTAGESAPAVLPSAYLEGESDDTWRFVAPVLVGNEVDSPFNTSEANQEMLGYVRVVKSKATLKRMQAEVFAVNFAVSFIVSLIFLVILRTLTQRMTRPLMRLSSVMAQAESGVSGLRADTDGPKDIADMSTAFNRMMTVLEDRETELRTARDNALKFAQLKANFAATVSHEIRTPLNGVVGTLDILMATDLPSKQHQFVEIAWDSSRYLLDLINNILDFSKLEADKVALEKMEFGISHLIESVLELLSTQALQKKLAVDYLVAPSLPSRMLGDPRRLRQILINLIGNALKFTESGSVSVRVSATGNAAESRLDEAMTLRFEVVDTGIGITHDMQSSIFDSFTQEDTSTTRRFGGSGLGLAISKQLVELMGGQIGVDSTPGLGSCFWFTVPLTPVATPERSASIQPSWPGLRALVIDESEIVRRFLQQTLTVWGFDCQTSLDADDALGELNAAGEAGQPYRIVILDTTFATSDGNSLPARIQREGNDGPRLILMNRFGADHVPSAVRADAYLAKPLRVERLLEAISGALGNGLVINDQNVLTYRTENVDDVSDINSRNTLPQHQANYDILVVEDNRTNQAIVQGLLEVLGCKAEIAEDGAQGLLAFKRQSWDLIFMDCCMPEMDGYQVTAAVRSIERTGGKRTPIVAMTANVQEVDIEKCLASGMDDHLAKPLTMETLAAKLKRWIAHYAVEGLRGETAPRTRPVEGNGETPLDMAKLDKLREQLGSSFGQAVRPFLEDMPIYLEQMEQAIAAGDADALGQAAHAIKGAAGNLGAEMLAQITREIEESAIAAHVSAANDMVTHARAEYALVQQALLGELKAAPSTPSDDTSKGALVLVVDDDRSTRATLRYALQRSGFSVEEAGDGMRALSLLDRVVPDVILLDAMMPVMDGFTTCARLQAHPRGRSIPVLMITALEDDQSIERAFAAGASDYLPKPLNLAVVNQRIKRVVEAQRAEKHVQHLVFNDTLTGLPNRIQFADYLNRAIERAKTTNHSLALLFLDLDRFKYVNDTLGHEIGDRLIKAVASRIRNCVRASDCVARLGGDEFTVLIDELDDPASATNAAQKIRRSLTSSFEIDGQDIFVSTSVGISLYPEDGTDVSTLLRHADTAMYRAKRSNSGVEFYEEGMEASVSEQLRMDSALRRALERNELLVYYQPKADAKTGRITGMEALVRWMHPERGLISPLEFVPLAEETGLIISIGEFVLRSACAQTKRWLDAGIPELNVAVNLSGVQLQEKDLCDLVSSILQETRLEARHLTLEITESMLMEHTSDIVETLQRLKKIGVRMDIDDFGTGYSSLAYLKRFPVDALKIDHTFTRDMTRNPDDAAIITGIIALAHSLRLKVVAEGVEMQEQLDLLKQLGCDSIQGYLLGQPLAASEFAKYILTPHFPTLNFAEQTA